MIPPPAPQLCAHLRKPGRGRRTTVAGGLVVELCKACVQELGERFAEEERPTTPIEEQAHRAEVEMANGCTYDVGKKGKEYVPCGKLCDFGDDMCPRHKVFAKFEAEQQAAKEHEREMKRGPSKVTPYTGKAA